MPMSSSNRTGVFMPHEIEAMRIEFDAEARTDETPQQREERASAIVARHIVKQTDTEPPQS